MFVFPPPPFDDRWVLTLQSLSRALFVATVALFPIPALFVGLSAVCGLCDGATPVVNALLADAARAGASAADALALVPDACGLGGTAADAALARLAETADQDDDAAEKLARASVAAAAAEGGAAARALSRRALSARPTGSPEFGKLFSTNYVAAYAPSRRRATPRRRV